MQQECPSAGGEGNWNEEGHWQPLKTKELLAVELDQHSLNLNALDGGDPGHGLGSVDHSGWGGSIDQELLSVDGQAVEDECERDKNRWEGGRKGHGIGVLVDNEEWHAESPYR